MIIKRLAPLAVLLWSSFALADLSPLCLKRLETGLRDFKPIGHWIVQENVATARSEYASTERVGAWIERRFYRTQDRVDILRVIAAETTVLSCTGAAEQPTARTVRRTFTSSSRSVDDESLHKIVRSRRRGLVYLWSPNMPLSLRGISEIQKAALARKMPLTVLLDPRANPEQSKKLLRENGLSQDFSVRAEAIEIYYRGGLRHFPSLLIYKNGSFIGAAMMGFRKANAYRVNIEETLKKVEKASDKASTDLTRFLSLKQSYSRIPKQVKLIRTVNAPTYITGGYSKPIWATDWMLATGLHIGEKGFKPNNLMLNMTTGRSIEVPGFVDNYPSPDGKYIISPRSEGFDAKGLYIYDASDFLKTEREPGFKPLPLHLDKTLPAWYPSVALLKSGVEKSIYRVLSSSGDQVVIRDFEITHSKGPTKRVRARGGKTVLCSGMRLAAPMISKTGTEFAATEFSDSSDPWHSLRSMKIFRIGATGEDCTEEVTLPLLTSKIAFDASGDQIAFHVNESDLAEDPGTFAGPDVLFTRRAYVYRRSTRELYDISSVISDKGLSAMYPEFLSNGDMSFVATDSDGDNEIVEVRIEP